MGLFGKKKEVIPEVQAVQRSTQAQARFPAPAPGSPAPSYRTAPAYVPPSQGGGGYGAHSHYSQNNYAAAPPPQQYGPNGYPLDHKSYGQSGGAPRGQAPDAMREQLFQGGRAPAQSSSQYGTANGGESDGRDPYASRTEQEEEDDEVEGIKQQMRFGKQEGLASTRNAVRIAQEAEETARVTLDKLGEQSDRIANTERHLDMAKAHNDRAADEAKELKNLNKSIFRPSFTFNKNSKRDKEEQRILTRHQEEQAERESTRQDQYDSRQRIEGTYKSMDRMAENAAGAKSRVKARGTERDRYQFESTASDDEVEDEIDHNLGEMSDVVGRLKALAMTAGQEVDAQNKKLDRLDPKVSGLSNKITLNTQRLGRIK